MDARGIASGIRRREFSVREVVSACLGRVEAVNPRINALTEVRPEAALAAADAADRAVADGKPLGLLHGVPVTIKGNVDQAGWATVNGCAALRENIARATSPCVQNWLDAGAIVIGRTNTPEFCCRWETSNEVFGPTRNPWNPARTPGGSSGGAAASLAVGITPLGHGNDLGGSLRQPAQACGIASIRPGLGRVPLWNPSEPEPPIGIQLMHVEGPMARRVEDVRLGLRAMAIHDRRDPWSNPSPPVDATGPRPVVALVIDPGGRGVSEQVASGARRAGKLLQDAGYTVEEVEPPGILEAADIWKVICLGELLTGLEPAVKNICGPSLRRAFDCYRTLLPGGVTLEMYTHAFGRRRALLRDWLEFFARYGVVVAPVGTQPPLPTDGDIASAENMVNVVESFRMTVAVNALGLPAAVVPVGSGDGMPQVVQIIGPPLGEMRCLDVAAALEHQAGSLTPIDPK